MECCGSIYFNRSRVGSGTFAVGWSGDGRRPRWRNRWPVPGQAEGGLWVLLRTRMGEGSWGKVEFSVGFSLCVQDYQRRRRGVRGGISCSRGTPAGPVASAPWPFSRGGERSPLARAAALPPRRRRAVDCGLGAAAASRRPPALFPGPSRAEPCRRGEGKQWSREQKR